MSAGVETANRIDILFRLFESLVKCAIKINLDWTCYDSEPLQLSLGDSGEVFRSANFQSHVNMISKTIKAKLYCFKMIRHLIVWPLNPDILLYPDIFTYVIWSDCLISDLLQVEIIQSKFLKHL